MTNDIITVPEFTFVGQQLTDKTTEKMKEALASVMRMRAGLKEDQQASKDHWKHHEALQAFRDCLEAFKQAQIIESYNLETGEIKYQEK